MTVSENLQAARPAACIARDRLPAWRSLAFTVPGFLAIMTENMPAGLLPQIGAGLVERVSAGVDQLDHAVKTAGMAASGECPALASTPMRLLDSMKQRRSCPLKRFQEKWKHFSGSETRQDKDLEPFMIP